MPGDPFAYETPEEKKTAPLAGGVTVKDVTEYQSLLQSKDNLDEKISLLYDKLLLLFDLEETGEFAVVVGDKVVEMKRSETWSWDSDVLEQALPTASVPDYVKRKFSIDKKRFERLDAAEQQEYIAALTRKPGKASIKVIDHKE